MNILMIGQNDPAGMMMAFANAINRYTTHTARVLSYRTMYSADYEYDIELPRIDEDFSEVEHLLQTADVFHFHMLMDENHQIGPLLIKDYIRGKKLLHHHHGTYDHQIFLATAGEYREKYKKLKRRAIVSTPDLLQLLPEATWQPNLVPLRDVELLPRYDHQQHPSQVIVAQAPTRRWHKHTAEFLRVTERLSKRLPQLRSLIIEGKRYKECLKIKRNCHMVFDHMNGWFGIASLESLAHGVPTLAGLDDWNIGQIKAFTGADRLPWVLTRSEEELEREIERLTIDNEARLAIGKASRAFLEQSWTEQQVLAVLETTYQSL